MSNKIELPCDVGEVSDGYHTFSELYDHRCLLWVNLLLVNKENAFKTLRDDSGVFTADWFIAGLDTEFGQITYHLPIKYWDFVESIKEIESNSNYDGHTSGQVIGRLKLMALRESNKL